LPEKDRFTESLWPYAVETERKTGIPAAWLIAMARNETGGDLKKPLFGIKALPGEASGNYPTWEVEGGKRVNTRADFASDASIGAAFERLARNMLSPRYKDAPKTNAYDFAKYLQGKGWATDQDYAGKISRLAGGSPPSSTKGSSEPKGEPKGDATMGDEKPTRPRPVIPAGPKEERGKALVNNAEQFITIQEGLKASLEAKLSALLAAYNALPDNADPTELDKRITSVEAQLKAVDAKISKAEEAIWFSDDVLGPSLSEQRNLLQDQIAAGVRSTAEAKAEWDRNKDAATMWREAILAPYEIIERLAPYMMTRQGAETVMKNLGNWDRGRMNELKPIEPAFIPIDLDIVGQLKDYLPPAPNWKGMMNRGTEREQEINDAAKKPPEDWLPEVDMSGWDEQGSKELLPSMDDLFANSGLSSVDWRSDSKQRGGHPIEMDDEPIPPPTAKGWDTYSEQMGGGSPREPWQESIGDISRDIGRFARGKGSPEGLLGVLGDIYAQTAGKVGDRLKSGEVKEPPYRGPVVDEKGKPLDPPNWLTSKQKNEFLERQGAELARRKKPAAAW